MMSFFELIDEKFFNPFCCRNREIYIACIEQLIEKSKEIPVLYEVDARNTLILYLKNCEYINDTENIGEEVSSRKSPQENVSAILRYFLFVDGSRLRKSGVVGIILHRCQHVAEN